MSIQIMLNRRLFFFKKFRSEVHIKWKNQVGLRYMDCMYITLFLSNNIEYILERETRSSSKFSVELVQLKAMEYILLGKQMSKMFLLHNLIHIVTQLCKENTIQPLLSWEKNKFKEGVVNDIIICRSNTISL